MLLIELFDKPVLDPVDDLRKKVMDVITPFAANDVPFISINQIVDKLNGVNSGLAIDRALVMHILDPEKIKLIKKIEGDRIYLSVVQGDDNAYSDEEEKSNEDKVKSSATKQASKAVKPGKIEKQATKFAKKDSEPFA